MLVSRGPPPGTATFKHCKELNLYNNLLSRWTDVFDILCYFPALLSLDLRKNRLDCVFNLDLKQYAHVVCPLSCVVFDGCGIDSTTAAAFATRFPSISELYLRYNGIHDFKCGDFGGNINHVDLEGNPLNYWRNLDPLSKLPKLTSLHVANCGFSIIEIGSSVGFLSLESLNIRENLIHDWPSISALARLPKLHKLFYKGNKLQPFSGLDLREIFIAKLPNLDELEKSGISSSERRASEIHFLNACGIPPVMEFNVDDIQRLKSIYGEPIRSTRIVNKMNLVTLKLIYNDHPLVKSFPENMTVQRMMGLIGRTFQINARKINLEAVFDDGRRIQLDNPMQSVHHYSVSDCDFIQIKQL
ncbi:hypothetical protein AB6A40_008325 [Gnathostoma spinigerum]|uniref:Ubiquitin-like domain-containing protein n=1 Tax=Gnathostoma spinigerum TaxID=75299 RepID=A0ABD6EQP0_9BILA